MSRRNKYVGGRIISLTLYGLKLPEIKPGDSIADIILEAAKEQCKGIEDGDVILITSKILSKAMNLLIKIHEISPLRKAVKIARKSGWDPRVVQILLDESDSILLAIPFKKLIDKGIVRLEKIAKDVNKARKAAQLYPTIFITLRNGQLWSDSGLDFSNHPPGICSVPPRDLDNVARDIALRIKEKSGKEVAVVICDTELFPFGSLDVARGSYGITPVSRSFGEFDRFGKPKFGGVDHIAHELCCAAALLMRQCAEGIPVVIVRGLKYEKSEEGITPYVMDLNRIKSALIDIFIHTVKVLGFKHVLSLIISFIRS